MNDSYKNWNFDDFLSFILFHAAMADFNFAEAEKELMLKHVSQEKLTEIRNFHKHNSDYENIQVIMYCKEKFCADSNATDKIEAAIKTMFDSDGDFNLLERNMYRAIDLILKC